MDEEDFNLGTLVSAVSVAAMMFGGVVPYIPQYRDIVVTENADGFSLYVCLALLVANTLRILFWFGHPFESPLLIQSIVMNVTMFVLIRLCVKIKGKNQIIKSKERHFFASSKAELDGHNSQSSKDFPSMSAPSHVAPHVFWDFDVDYFWAWTDFLSYVEFMTTFTGLVGVCVYLFLDISWFVETIGFLAVFVEAMLGAPQFYRNYESKSTDGMSKKMVCMWLCGDIFKTVYFLARDSPMQFWLCGLLQVSIDVAILMQVVIYFKNPSVPKAKPGPYVS